MQTQYLEVSGDSYTDEATGANVVDATTLRAAVINVREHTNVNITAITEAAGQL
jgi:hypothetical protein